MKRFQDIWAEQSETARGILEAHGPLAALDYLVGEKLMTYVATAEGHPEFARELPKFVAAIRELFDTDVIGVYIFQGTFDGDLLLPRSIAVRAWL